MTTQLRARINTDMKQAMRDKNKLSLATLRLINAAIKDRDIAARAEDRPDGIDDAEVLSVLAKMVKQREESARIYDENSRPELAEGERSEIVVIQRFLPKPLSDAELKLAVKAAIEAVDASCLKDMGKVMGQLKADFAGQMDMGKAGAEVKAILMG